MPCVCVVGAPVAVAPSSIRRRRGSLRYSPPVFHTALRSRCSWSRVGAVLCCSVSQCVGSDTLWTGERPPDGSPRRQQYPSSRRMLLHTTFRCFLWRRRTGVDVRGQCLADAISRGKPLDFKKIGVGGRHLTGVGTPHQSAVNHTHHMCDRTTH